eukprot:2104661-Lingulodinium_polyedra.AAC.1
MMDVQDVIVECAPGRQGSVHVFAEVVQNVLGATHCEGVRQDRRWGKIINRFCRALVLRRAG